MRPRFGGDEPCRDTSLALDVCTRLGSGLAFDLLSPLARRGCLTAAPSSSAGGTSVGDEAFRFPRASRDRTIFLDYAQHRNVGRDATTHGVCSVRARARFEWRVLPLNPLRPQTQPMAVTKPMTVAVTLWPSANLWPGDPCPALSPCPPFAALRERTRSGHSR